MRRKKWIILGVCMLFCMINIAGCVKKESKKITTGSSVDNREGNRHQAVMLIMTLQI